MNQIKLLPDDVILKIAAGEVIDRPSSVVKEILENAIDAGATKVLVDISGDVITIEDNGKGMSLDDLKLAPLKHATSKITDADDLFDIHSLGFRGEALASITAISLTEITSKQLTETEANTIILEGGNELSIDVAPYPHASGTRIIVKNLFFNTPARKKYLKTDANERRHSIDVVSQYMLAYEHVNFKVTVDGKSVLTAPSAKIKDRFYNLYGQDTKQMIILEDIVGGKIEETRNELQEKGVSMSGLISNPKLYKKSRSDQILFVNNRLVKSQIVYAAVAQAYKGYLNTGEHPVTVLKITIDPAKIDVNVHPTKKEIKFEDEQMLFRAVYHTIKDSLLASDLSRKIESSDVKEELQKPLLPNLGSSSKPSKFQVPADSLAARPFSKNNENVVERTEQTVFNTPEASTGTSLETGVLEDSAPTIKQNEVVYETKTQTGHILRVIGIFNKEFVITEKQGADNKLVLVDFHAAAEIANYEKFSKQFEGEGIVTQALVQPSIFDILPADIAIVEEKKDYFKKFGYTVEIFGENSVLIRSVPKVMRKQLTPESFLDILSEVKDEKQKNSVENLKDIIITRMSCKASERAGDDLTLSQAQDILDRLFDLDGNVYNCPHGRPTMIEFSVHDLEKMFKRIR